MKKIIIVSPVQTHPTNAGNRSCILSYSNLLKEKGYDVYFLLIASGFRTRKESYTECFQYWGDKMLLYRVGLWGNILLHLYKIFFKCTGYNKLDSVYPWGIKKFIRKTQKEKQFDTVIVNYVFLSRIFKHFKESKKILYTHDAFTNKYQFTGQEWFSLTPNDEAKGLNRSDAILSIQENESIFYSYLTSKNIYTVYSYFTIQKTPLIREKTILYLAGSMTYNTESIVFFLTEVFPELEKLYPDVKLIIGGTICNDVKHIVKNKESVVLQGHVPDLLQFYNSADICINPTFRGTGLKIKTFEALSFGKILVSHPHSTNGIYAKDKAPIFLAETKDEYIKQFKYLFDNMNSWEKFKQDSIDYMQRFQEYVKLQFDKAIM
ncbi:glycosyltransferase family 4 protein [Bacteroidales bacterium OttesenSCG-928-A17]|nr:glycosyltransferase family 4 protein [Bacteroidales bacterium OttesenSCG-928-A17]